MPNDDTSTDSSVEEGTSKVVIKAPTRPVPPLISKTPPHPSEDPPPYSSSHHAQASGLLSSSSSAPPRTPSQAANNRNSRSPPGYRRYTQYLTKRNLLILAGIILFLIVVASIVAWISGSEDEYYVPPAASNPLPSDRGQVKELESEWKLLGAFTLHESRMSFDENTDSIVLSKYFPAEHQLKCEKLEVDKAHKEYISSSSNISQIYDDCTRFTDEVICCSTSPHGHQHRTDCFLNIDNQVIKSVAAHYDFVQNWQSLADDSKLLILKNKQRHAVLNLKTKRVHKIEENRLPHGYISIAFFFPMDNADELDELVRNGEEFRICEYKQTLAGDYALQAPDCRVTPFHIEFELPKVRFCSNPIYTAVVQYGHRLDERDLSFHLKLVFDNNAEVYTARDKLESNYDQLVIDCNDEAIEIYAMGSYEVARFSIKLPNLHSERFIQTRI